MASNVPAGSGRPFKRGQLTSKQCERIRNDKRSTDMTNKQLATRFGVQSATISQVLNGKYAPYDD